MRKIALVLWVVVFMGWLNPGPVAATDNAFQTVFKDGFYGGMAGALVGGAVLLLRDDPGDHLNYISTGAAVGVIVGATFGILRVSQSFAEIEDRKLVFHFPVPELQIRSVGRKRTETHTSVGLLKVNF